MLTKTGRSRVEPSDCAMPHGGQYGPTDHAGRCQSMTRSWIVGVRDGEMPEGVDVVGVDRRQGGRQMCGAAPGESAASQVGEP